VKVTTETITNTIHHLLCQLLLTVTVATDAAQGCLCGQPVRANGITELLWDNSLVRLPHSPSHVVRKDGIGQDRRHTRFDLMHSPAT